ncbi:MaoC/PaaZ C-terminal domain-containing protein [Streptomyces sp. NBC_00257]|uniref:MaoC/PaaZ C-terminal domain-containing protein n=1 Tax=unclassified Streptomyces TaxID=2593676 RepID=UPI002252FCB3|nr:MULTISPECIES: MaoC/PaaZ C-terminal domain-containing protein [unclassified Streptomyces]MCX5430967.1 MaoC/PaaZ C-terminal domain-containing protein [Streptomyces sp. NBC_00062]
MTVPSLNAALVRGAVTSPFKRAGRPGATLPADRAVLPAAPIAAGPLASYRRICGFTEPDTLPLTYPHVLGFPLAMRLMTARRFPLPVVGLVHTWIEITRHRTLHPTDRPELTVYAESLAPHRRGTEVTMVTEARLAGEPVWESRSGYLSRHATPTGSGPTDTGPAPTHTGPDSTDTGSAPRDTTPVPELPAVAEWRLPGDLGRRYGAASGDRNPIHLYPLTARLFGFPRAIAHGMWTVARCLAETPEPQEVHGVRADFRAPVLLPATVTYAADTTGFQLRSAGRLHLTGRIRHAPGPAAARDGRS